eukprot:366503-Chlamydomonas_euryale.AAC.12
MQNEHAARQGVDCYHAEADCYTPFVTRSSKCLLSLISTTLESAAQIHGTSRFSHERNQSRKCLSQ